MNSNKLILVLGVVLIGIVYKVSGACEDSVTRKSPIEVLDPKTKKVKAKINSCTQLVNKWPIFCADKSGEIVIGGNGGRCCQSCKAVDTTCLDTLTKQNDYRLGGKKIKSCKMMVKKFPALCDTEGKKGGKCCQACKGVDIKCVDDPRVLFTADSLACNKYIKQDKCRCVEKADTCCKSCKDVDTDALGCNCRDLLSPENPATIAITDPQKNNEAILSKDVDNCKEIVEYFAQFCKNLGGENGGCCKSCQGVDPDCKDNLLWKGSISFKGNTCNDCTCHDIRRKSVKLMRKACKDNIKRDGGGHKIRTACCLQCTKLGFPPE